MGGHSRHRLQRVLIEAVELFNLDALHAHLLDELREDPRVTLYGRPLHLRGSEAWLRVRKGPGAQRGFESDRTLKITSNFLATPYPTKYPEPPRPTTRRAASRDRCRPRTSTRQCARLTRPLRAPGPAACGLHSRPSRRSPKPRRRDAPGSRAVARSGATTRSRRVFWEGPPRPARPT